MWGTELLGTGRNSKRAHHTRIHNCAHNTCSNHRGPQATLNTPCEGSGRHSGLEGGGPKAEWRSRCETRGPGVWAPLTKKRSPQRQPWPQQTNYWAHSHANDAKRTNLMAQHATLVLGLTPSLRAAGHCLVA